MSAQTMRELLVDMDRIEKLLRTLPKSSNEHQEASMRLSEIIREVRRRTCFALGGAFSVMLAGMSETDPKLVTALGARFLVELRIRGLEVIPFGNLPPT